jgi:hypothetical protein
MGKIKFGWMGLGLITSVLDYIDDVIKDGRAKESEEWYKETYPDDYARIMKDREKAEKDIHEYVNATMTKAEQKKCLDHFNKMYK